MPEPIVEHEVEYESVLVAFEDAALLARGGRHRGQARGAAPARHPRPRHDHRADHLADRRGAARAGARAPRQTIDSARVLGGRRVTGHWEKVRPGEAGRRIVDEARADQGARDRHGRRARRARAVAVRPHARVRARGPALPGDHRRQPEPAPSGAAARPQPPAPDGANIAAVHRAYRALDAAARAR